MKAEDMREEDSPPLPEFIGTARMEQDGTLVLHLFAEENTGGQTTRGSAVFTYAPDSPQYADMLSHIGPIEPGQEVGVRPWPDSV